MPEEASIDESGELDTTLLSTNWKKYSPSSFDIYSAGVVLVQLALKPVRTQPAHDTYSSSSPAAEPRYVRLCKDDRLNPVLRTVGTVYECHHFNVRHILNGWENAEGRPFRAACGVTRRCLSLLL